MYRLLGQCWVVCLGYCRGVSLLCRIPFWGRQRVFVAVLKYLGDTVCRSLASNVDKSSWRLGSCQIHPVAQGPKLCMNVKRYSFNFSSVRSGWAIFAIDHSTLAILPPVRYFLYPICWGIPQRGLSLIDLVVWRLEQCNELLGLGICCGEHCWPPGIGLTVLSILLDLEGHFQFLWDFHWICD